MNSTNLLNGFMLTAPVTLYELGGNGEKSTANSAVVSVSDTQKVVWEFCLHS